MPPPRLGVTCEGTSVAVLETVALALKERGEWNRAGGPRALVRHASQDGNGKEPSSHPKG